MKEEFNLGFLQSFNPNPNKFWSEISKSIRPLQKKKCESGSLEHTTNVTSVMLIEDTQCRFIFVPPTTKKVKLIIFYLKLPKQLPLNTAYQNVC